MVEGIGGAMTICYAGTQLVESLNDGLGNNSKRADFLKADTTGDSFSDTVKRFADPSEVDPYADYLDKFPDGLRDDVVDAGRNAIERGDQVVVNVSFSPYGTHSTKIASSYDGDGGGATTINLIVPPPPPRS